jgi:tetratricopeptide (TPR) repeat protein
VTKLSIPIRAGLLALHLAAIAAVLPQPLTLYGQKVGGLPSQAAGDSSEIGRGRILLVLPFDNNSATSGADDKQASSLDWLREAAPQVLNSRFLSAGFTPLNREDRLYALDHLGLPEGFQPSRATALRLAETLDADSIVIGSYSVTGTKLTLRGRIVDVAKLKISEEMVETGEIAQLIPLLNSLAWKVTRKLDPKFAVAEETFRAAGSKIRLDAFEQYVRGLTEHDTTERLKHLKKATDLNPDFTEAWLATAKLQFANQDYEAATVSFGKVTRGDPQELEAQFYRGLSLIYSGNYGKAEEAFAAVARVLPLPEVVNNEAVASSRRGHDAVALFRQAVAADPTDADYHFNLAVSLHRRGDKADSLAELGQSLKLRPNDSEAKASLELWKRTADKPAAQLASATSTDKPQEAVEDVPVGGTLERIKRSYNGAAFRQAGMMLDQVEAARLAMLPGPERAVRLSKSAHDKLDRGLLLEAEREYQSALSADGRSAEAHAGLAQVRERAGDSDAARKEAHDSLDRKPNLDAYLVLARLDLAANNLPAAREDAEQALHVDGSNRAAREMRKTIDSRMAASESKSADPKSAGTTKP